jgi:hypothetical protein
LAVSTDETTVEPTDEDPVEPVGETPVNRHVAGRNFLKI